jgi:hypothetical protein
VREIAWAYQISLGIGAGAQLFAPPGAPDACVNARTQANNCSGFPYCHVVQAILESSHAHAVLPLHPHSTDAL